MDSVFFVYIYNMYITKYRKCLLTTDSVFSVCDFCAQLTTVFDLFVVIVFLTIDFLVKALSSN